MRGRIATLKRLVTLYGVVEEMHAVELQRIASGVREAQQAIGLQQEVSRSARFDGRHALSVGDRMGWAMTETTRETAHWKRRRLEEIRLERERLRINARDQYVASRLKSEQMRRIVDHLAERMEIEEGHRTQAASDDRFLARQRWVDTQNPRDRDGQIRIT
jgi:hypothetical protein